MTPAQVAHIMALVDDYAVTAQHRVKEGGRKTLDDSIRARAAVEAALLAPQQAEPPEIDYEALIAACYKRTKAAQGTKGCVQFAAGAEWYREQIAARPSAPTAVEPAQRDREAFQEGYEAAQADAKVCELPPLGWICTRTRGHEGPCAAVESPDEAKLVADGMKRLKNESDPLEKLTRIQEDLGLYDDQGAPTAVEPDERAEREAFIAAAKNAGFKGVHVGDIDGKWPDKFIHQLHEDMFRGWMLCARASKGTPL